MLGAIIGDIVGSRFEFNNFRSKDFALFTEKNEATDDSIMTLAVADAIIKTDKRETKAEEFYVFLEKAVVSSMQDIGRMYPFCGFGGMFSQWVFSSNPKPYNSFGNGAAMRISPVGFIAKSEEEAIRMSKVVTVVTHNHKEGIKGAEATVVAIYMARQGCSKEQIRERINREYYGLDFTMDEIRHSYQFNETCQETVPQAIQAFLESTSFEDAIRTAISVGGDSDTLAAITGGIAQAYYGIPKDI
ncbi:MAG TPA: ADP-ribosylglycohydrolase, partial [Clostridiales bacterium]|nr:ADP-ribosylglycohydrolase [Clostridiales bacterium]